MTSFTAHPLVGELTPEQRQALFDKLRQRKLAQARMPVAQPVAATSLNHLPWSPSQQACAAPMANRVIEFTLASCPDLQQLGDCLQQLLQHHDGLHVHTSGTAPHFVAATGLVPWQTHQPQDQHTAEATLQQVRTTLAALNPANGCIQAAAVTDTKGTTHLLLSAHPLLLDHYSLLGLAHQWLALYQGQLPLDAIKPASIERQNLFSQWSRQLLDNKFLKQEWTRLKPRAQTGQTATCATTLPTHTTLELDQTFIETFLPTGEWLKGWLLDAVHRCLTQSLAHQEIQYWIEAPQLRAEQFEAQLGFFPYYLPVTRLQSDNDNEPLSAVMRLQRLQTRYSSVSEQLSIELCQNATTAPLIHYHWFDLDDNGAEPLQITGVQMQQPGLMLTPVEMHIIERLDGVTLDIHYLPEQISTEQVDYLLRNLLALLKQPKDTPSHTPPTVQERLRQIWKDLLQKTDIDDDQSFFELGGHSLQVTELKFRIKQHLKLDVPISVLYELSTIGKLANFILATHGNALGFSSAKAGDDDEEEGTL